MYKIYKIVQFLLVLLPNSFGILLVLLAGVTHAQEEFRKTPEATVTIPNGVMILSKDKCADPAILAHIAIRRISDDQWFVGRAEYTETGATQKTVEAVCWHIHPQVPGAAVSIDKDGYLYQFPIIVLKKNLLEGSKAI